MSSYFSVSDLEFRYPGATLASLHGISFSLGKGEVLSLMGESGSGKSSLIRLIAGFERPQEGEISLDGDVLTAGQGRFIRPEKRGVGCVSQRGDLFPHLTVAENISYGLKGEGSEEKKKRVTDLLYQVQLTGYERKYPEELSGGEQQRVALVRALALRPRLLLLDEPFSSLDTHLRKDLLQLTFSLLREQGTTAIFITHHSEDALRVGDAVGVMHEGTLLQCASPVEVWEKPASKKVAMLFHEINDYQDILEEKRTAAGLGEWGNVSDLSLSQGGEGSSLIGTVVNTEFLGDQSLLTIKLDGYKNSVKALSTDSSIEKGTRVSVTGSRHSNIRTPSPPNT